MPEDWWILFEDGQLDQFIRRVFIANPTLQAARANILLAAYNADRMKSDPISQFHFRRGYFKGEI